MDVLLRGSEITDLSVLVEVFGTQQIWALWASDASVILLHCWLSLWYVGSQWFKKSIQLTTQWIKRWASLLMPYFFVPADADPKFPGKPAVFNYLEASVPFIHKVITVCSVLFVSFFPSSLSLSVTFCGSPISKPSYCSCTDPSLWKPVFTVKCGSLFYNNLPMLVYLYIYYVYYVCNVCIFVSLSLPCCFSLSCLPFLLLLYQKEGSYL